MDSRMRDGILILTPNRIPDGVSKVVDFEEAISEALARGDARIVIDLQFVNYANSSGLGALVQAHLKAQEQGGGMVLVHVSKRIANVLDITKLSMVFVIAETEDEAIARLREPPPPAG